MQVVKIDKTRRKKYNAKLVIKLYGHKKI